LQVRQLVAHRAELFQPALVDDGDAHLGVRQPVFQRVGAEQVRDRHRDGAHLVAGHVRDAGFRPLRQDDGDAVAGHDAHRASTLDRRLAACCMSQKLQASVCPGLVLVIQREAGAILGPAPAAGRAML
jgi:hypothetical protein